MFYMETKKLMLHSLNVSEYSDLEIECLKVENMLFWEKRSMVGTVGLIYSWMT